MGFFMFAIICAGISAAVASGKNRNALGWGAAGFFFPLIGIVAIFCLPASEPSDQLAASEVGR